MLMITDLISSTWHLFSKNMLQSEPKKQIRKNNGQYQMNETICQINLYSILVVDRSLISFLYIVKFKNKKN